MSVEIEYRNWKEKISLQETIQEMQQEIDKWKIRTLVTIVILIISAGCNFWRIVAK